MTGHYVPSSHKGGKNKTVHDNTKQPTFQLFPPYKLIVY